MLISTAQSYSALMAGRVSTNCSHRSVSWAWWKVIFHRLSFCVRVGGSRIASGRLSRSAWMHTGTHLLMGCITPSMVSVASTWSPGCIRLQIFISMVRMMRLSAWLIIRVSGPLSGMSSLNSCRIGWLVSVASSFAVGRSSAVSRIILASTSLGIHRVIGWTRCWDEYTFT